MTMIPAKYDYPRPEKDWFTEAQWATHVLFDTVHFRGGILDPCAGSGNVLEVARARGHTALGGDIAGPRRELDGLRVARLDFRKWGRAVTDNVITNPPYEFLPEVIECALQAARHKVAVFTEIIFLSSQGRHDCFNKQWPVTQIIHICKRVPLGAGKCTIPRTAGRKLHCWIVFDHFHKGAPTTHWAMPTAEQLAAEPFVEGKE